MSFAPHPRRLKPRLSARLLGAGVVSCALTACGASAPPSEADIWYAESLRPGVELAVSPGEERALERMSSLPVDEPVELAGETFVAGPIYTAASARRCRRVQTPSRPRLACEDGQAGGWVFVPDVFTDRAPAHTSTPSETATPTPSPGPTAGDGGAS
ncbi:MAG: hypothetical protein CMN31_21440 [Sandaracinus sp.]|nr:hypothetical protein [Myxococcales bacterium]MAT25620.1 hypothetical protein [Sandaracinus sp.]MBJ73853.1 hypothetical protein [Sandaracinus sp.]